MLPPLEPLTDTSVQSRETATELNASGAGFTRGAALGELARLLPERVLQARETAATASASDGSEAARRFHVTVMGRTS